METCQQNQAGKVLLKKPVWPWATKEPFKITAGEFDGLQGEKQKSIRKKTRI